MNVSQATAEVQARGFDYLPPERILLMLNDAKNNLEDQWAWPWLEQTVTGPAPLAVPGLKYVLYVRDSDHDLELLGVDVRQIAEHGTTNQTGAPGWWWLDGPTGPEDIVTIHAWPTGPVTLEARVVAESPELEAEDDEPLIPRRYHSLWIDYAVAEAYHDSDNYVGAQALKADVAVRVQELIVRYETRNRQHSVMNSVRVGSLDD